MSRSASQTKQHILAQAQFLFAENGLDGVSVREIAQRSQINVALISHYFGGKKGLYEACVESMYQQISTFQPQVLFGITPPNSLSKQLHLLIAEAFEFACTHKMALLLIQRDILAHGQLAPQKRKKHFEPFIAQLIRFFPHLHETPLRLGVQSLIFLITRYALCPKDELRQIAPAYQQHELIAHLSSLAHHIFQIPQDPCLLSISPKNRPQN